LYLLFSGELGNCFNLCGGLFWPQY